MSVIIPLFKKEKLDDMNNYRPIVLLSQLSNILENIIANRFIHYIEKHNLLYTKQYGLSEILQLRTNSMITIMLLNQT